MKIIFNRDYSPRKKDEVFEAKSNEEKKVAEWYLANGIARKCCEGKDLEDCGCGKEKAVQVLEVTEKEVAKTEVTEKVEKEKK